MSSPEYIQYHGILLPPVAHSMESLEYAQNFSVEDTDVFAVTYPKSGTVFFSVSCHTIRVNVGFTNFCTTVFPHFHTGQQAAALVLKNVQYVQGTGR